MLCYEIFEQVAWAWCKIQQLMALLFHCYETSTYRGEALRFAVAVFSSLWSFQTDAILLVVLEHFLKFLYVIIIAILSLGHYQIKGR